MTTKNTENEIHRAGEKERQTVSKTITPKFKIMALCTYKCAWRALLPGYFVFETNFVISCDNVVRARNEEL